MIRILKLTILLIILIIVFTFILFESINVINWLATNTWKSLNDFIKACSGQIFIGIIISPIIAIYDYYLYCKSTKS